MHQAFLGSRIHRGSKLLLVVINSLRGSKTSTQTSSSRGRQ
jgi:hypothetical protein